MLINDKYYYRCYGLLPGEYQKMYDQQSRCCYICEGGVKKCHLAVDHIHIKNFKKLTPPEKRCYVRGLVCFRCNKFLIGMLDKYKNPRRVLKSLIQYFTEFKFKYDLEENGRE